jgi:hypothetical protein
LKKVDTKSVNQLKSNSLKVIKERFKRLQFSVQITNYRRIIKRRAYLQAGKTPLWCLRQKYRIGLVKKHGRSDWKELKAIKRDTPNKKIRELEKKLKWLEQEKEMLNRAIDVTNNQFHTDIRKKYFSLLSEATRGQA